MRYPKDTGSSPTSQGRDCTPDRKVGEEYSPYRAFRAYSLMPDGLFRGPELTN
jgi:hypothetical protein